MSTITFSGAIIRYAHLEKNMTRRLYITANYTKPVREAMEWQEIADCETMAQLEGELHGQKLTLTPNDEKLRKFEVQLDCGLVTGFGVFRPQAKEDRESRKTELRFEVEIKSSGSMAEIENYKEKIGEAPAMLKILHAEQEKFQTEKAAAAGA